MKEEESRIIGIVKSISTDYKKALETNSFISANAHLEKIENIKEYALSINKKRPKNTCKKPEYRRDEEIKRIKKSLEKYPSNTPFTSADISHDTGLSPNTIGHYFMHNKKEFGIAYNREERNFVKKNRIRKEKIIKLIENSKTNKTYNSEKLSDETGLSVRSIAAYAAHVTKGTYEK